MGDKTLTHTLMNTTISYTRRRELVVTDLECPFEHKDGS
jgi:hypothetical protein